MFVDDLLMNDDVIFCLENWLIIVFVYLFCFVGEGGILDFYYEIVIFVCKIIFLIRVWIDY